MKTLIKVALLSVFFLMMGLNKSHAQSKEICFKGKYELKIPDECKLDKDIPNDKLTFIKFYDKELKTNFYIGAIVTEKKEVKFKFIWADKPIKYAAKAENPCKDGYRACARECTNKPTTVGVILCTFYCMVDCSGL
jgi:hypothetical protein